MKHLEALLHNLPEFCDDLKHNTQAVLYEETLTRDERIGCGFASAAFLQDRLLLTTLHADAGELGVPAGVLEDAKAAAVLMRMNTVYYRTQHMADHENLASLPIRLRMNRMHRTTSGRRFYELFALTCAALAGCQMCIQAHMRTLADMQVSEVQMQHAIRIAATVSGLQTAAWLRPSAEVTATET